jgi:hypothetical protein
MDNTAISRNAAPAKLGSAVRNQTAPATTAAGMKNINAPTNPDYYRPNQNHYQEPQEKAIVLRLIEVVSGSLIL